MDNAKGSVDAREGKGEGIGSPMFGLALKLSLYAVEASASPDTLVTPIRVASIRGK